MTILTTSTVRPGQFRGIVFQATDVDMYALSPEQLEAMRNGQAPDTAPAPDPGGEAGESPAEEAAESPAQEQQEEQGGQQEQPEQAQGDSPNFKAMRQQLQRMQQLLQDPTQLAAFLRANGYEMQPMGATPQAARAAGEAKATPTPDAADPFGAFDAQTQAALKAVLQAHTQPLLEKLGTLETQRDQAQKHAELVALETEHPGLIANARTFDQVMPDQAHVDPMVKHLTMLGNRLTDPGQHGALVKELLAQLPPDEARSIIEPIAKGHAVAMVADKITDGKASRPKPVTLGGVTPSRGNGDEHMPDINTITAAEWAKLPQHVKDRYLG